MAEKRINQMPPELRRIFTKGNEALSRENLDYAIDLFNQILKTDPTFYECRKLLRTAQQRKAAHSGGGFFKKVLSSAGAQPHIAKAQVVLHSNPAEAIAVAEQVLNSDPNSSGAHRIVVEGAKALEMPNTMVYSLEVLAKNSPKDKHVAIQFGQTLAEIGETTRAERVLVEFARAMPHDQDVAQALKDVSAKRTLKEGGYDALSEGKGSYRDILKDEKQAVTLEQEQRAQKTEDVAERLIAEYETRLKTEPDNLRLVRQLAELHTQKKEFEKALSYYDRLKTSEIGSDAGLDRAIADTIGRRFDYQIEQLNPFAADHDEQVAKIKAEKLEFLVSECQKRVERFPTDLAIRFEMGTLYFQAGKNGEAIKEFQKAQANPHKRIASMNYLAQCFARRNIFDLAADTLQDAIKEKTLFDEEKKELVYNLGGIFESMGKKAEAIEQYKLIYKVDSSYRDVEKKMDEYLSGQ
jgi:tetratricopeptide (TPR) repeat protein